MTHSSPRTRSTKSQSYRCSIRCCPPKPRQARRRRPPPPRARCCPAARCTPRRRAAAPTRRRPTLPMALSSCTAPSPRPTQMHAAQAHIHVRVRAAVAPARRRHPQQHAPASSTPPATNAAVDTLPATTASIAHGTAESWCSASAQPTTSSSAGRQGRLDGLRAARAEPRLRARVDDDRRRALGDRQREGGAVEVHALDGGAARDLDVAAQAARDAARDGEAHADAAVGARG
jgi:hypothetical protein